MTEITANVGVAEGVPAELARQYEVEMEMRGLGVASYRRRTQDAREQGTESTTSYGSLLLRRQIEPLAAAITAFVEDAFSRPSRRSVAAVYLKGMDPKVVAFITGKVLIDGMTSNRKLTVLAIRIGDALEDECQLAAFERAKGRLYDAVLSDLTERTSNMHWRKRVLKAAAGRTGQTWEGWQTKDKLHLGQALVGLFVEVTGFGQIVNVNEGKNRTATYLQPTEALCAWIERHRTSAELLCPAFMPCVVKPKPWTSPTDGGYWFLGLFRGRPTTLVKTGNKRYVEELANRVDDMPVVYEAVNAMQETGWRVNARTLATLRQVWDGALPLGKLPRREDEPLPAKPADIDTNKEALVGWKRVACKVHERNAKSRSRRLQVAKVIWTAEKFAAEPAIYFPHQLDFRGRCYAMPMFLNPQGADWAKGLLSFAEGKPITTPEAARWFLIHGANLFGIDKVSFEERLDWVYENEQRIIAAATDPLVETFWSDADSPWQFLTWCFEYAGWAEQGYGFVSHIPVALDGSCNGLQHFSAMLRDPVGGAAVNLLPAERPQDIYQRVADVVVEKLRAIPAGDEHGELAAEWLAFGVNRKVTKRPVMVLPYGGTMFSCREYVQDYVVEKGDHPWGDDLFAACNFLAKLVWESIGEVVVAARAAMGWLQKAAAVAGAEGLPVTWTTPVGLPVLQAYPEYESRRVKTKVGDSLIYLTLREELPAIDKRRQTSAISPNFVHSMDAAALQLYVVTAKDHGITSFSLVHDSYGTLAADTELSAQCLRAAFVTIYRDHDVLAEFRQSLLDMISIERQGELPELPEKGSLDIEQVLEAAYFFA